jgi:prolyl oligopeptidase
MKPLLACLIAVFPGFLPAVLSAAEPEKPLAAPVKPVTDDYFGHKIVDPYRYMENLKDSAVQNWIRAQAGYTSAVLARIPGRPKLLARLHELDNSTTARITALNVLSGDVLFYEKTLAGENVARLYMRRGIRGEERLILDPTRLDKPGGPPHVINYYVPSWSGRFVAAGISEGGSEQAAIHIVDTESARELPDTIDRAPFGIVAWKDSKSFFYNRLQKMLPGMPDTEKELKSTVWLHTLGSDVDQDVPIFGYDRSPAARFDPIDVPIVATTPGSPFAAGIIAHGVKNEVTIYVAPMASMTSAEAIPWKKVADVDDGITDAAVRGDDLYLVSHKDAPRSKILMTSLAHPDVEQAAVVLPQQRGVVRGIGASEDAVYIRELDGGVARLVRIPYDSRTPAEIKLPFYGNIELYGTDPRVPGVFIGLSNWVKASRIYRYAPETKQLADTGLQPLGKYDDPQDVISEEVQVPSYDGTLVPLSVIHSKNIELNGENPTLLYGYGAYGMTIDPAFLPTRLAWIERGGVYAVAHVRGGGEYGEEWYRAGYKLTKPNTWRDFIACAEYLVKRKYTSPGKLAGMGGSAGGILIGRSITERPDLFGAAIDAVGVSDTLRVELSENGPVNIPEFGSVKTLAGFEDLYTMSSYAHVRDRVRYPAVMLTTGINDPRVTPWEAAKMAARLQAATSSGKPVLLRVDYQAGHGIGNTKEQREKEMADEWSFLLWQFGIPGFQPADGR